MSRISPTTRNGVDMEPGAFGPDGEPADPVVLDHLATLAEQVVGFQARERPAAGLREAA
jgi:hypothetical protein